MRVVAFNGSPRPGGNTFLLIKEVFRELETAGIQTELVQVGGQRVQGCTACYHCFTSRNKRCMIEDDPVNDWITKMDRADGILLASPTYVTDVTPELKALIDRACLVAKANGDMLARKIGAAVVAVRRGGAVHAFDTINHFFTINQMIIPGSCYWNFGMGLEPGDVREDEEGLKTMRLLGQNMAWLLKKTVC